MHKGRQRLLLAAVLAVLALASTASASAYELSIAPSEGAIAMPSLGSLTFEGGYSLKCPYTLNGALLPGPIPIATGERVGSITEVRINNEGCEGGSLRGALVSEAAPWSVTIGSVPAGLPNEIRALELVIHHFAIQLSVYGGFINCLWRGDLPVLLSTSRTRTSGRYLSLLAAILANSLVLVEGGFGCPSSGSFRGTLGLAPQQTLTIS